MVYTLYGKLMIIGISMIIVGCLVMAIIHFPSKYNARFLMHKRQICSALLRTMTALGGLFVADAILTGILYATGLLDKSMIVALAMIMIAFGACFILYVLIRLCGLGSLENQHLDDFKDEISKIVKNQLNQHNKSKAKNKSAKAENTKPATMTDFDINHAGPDEPTDTIRKVQ